MTEEFHALVLSTIKYGDYSLICRCYTERVGLKSFILKSRPLKGKSSTSATLLIPLSQVFIVNFLQKNTALTGIRHIRSARFYKSLHTSPPKIHLAIFLSEFLTIVLKEDQADPALFRYLINSFNQLDNKGNGFADFHLWFMLGLTKFLGFYPNTDQVNREYFDLQNGIFLSEHSPASTFLNREDSHLLKELIGLDFQESFPEKSFEKHRRKRLLSILLKYYQIHHENFHIPRFLEILSEIS